MRSKSLVSSTCLLHSSYAGESLKTSGQKRVKCSLWEKLDEAGRVRTRRRGVAPAGRGGRYATEAVDSQEVTFWAGR